MKTWVGVVQVSGVVIRCAASARFREAYAARRSIAYVGFRRCRLYDARWPHLAEQYFWLNSGLDEIRGSSMRLSQNSHGMCDGRVDWLVLADGLCWSLIMRSMVTWNVLMDLYCKKTWIK